MSGHGEQQFTRTYKYGFFIGTIWFILSLPLTVMLSILPIGLFDKIVTGEVAIMMLGLLLIFMGGVLSLVMSIIAGIAVAFIGQRIDRRVHASFYIKRMFKKEAIVSTPRTVLGGWIGSIVGLLVVIFRGNEAIATITEKVEHLFPAPLTLSLGNIVSVSVSHGYALAAGLLTITLFCVVAGSVAGIFIAIFIDRLTQK